MVTSVPGPRRWPQISSTLLNRAAGALPRGTRPPGSTPALPGNRREPGGTVGTGRAAATVGAGPGARAVGRVPVGAVPPLVAAVGPVRASGLPGWLCGVARVPPLPAVGP